MKNRDKYKAEIVKAILSRNKCEFMTRIVFPEYIPGADDTCSYVNNCSSCSELFEFWLDEEYVEPPKPEVDWSKVPVDTLVLVRDSEEEPWKMRYFKGVDDKAKRRFEAWYCGATSMTADGYTNRWKYCELVDMSVEQEN